MLRVRIEMCPRGDESRARELGRMYIANDGTGTAERGDYKVAVCRKGSTAVPREIVGPPIAAERLKEFPKAMRAGTVKDYPRLAYNVWRLIARALYSAFPEERTAKGTEPRIDHTVMRGLSYLVDRAQTAGYAAESSGEEWAQAQAAVAWLAAANAEQPTDDDKFGDALGCDKEPDEREEYQRSIFRGLRALAAYANDTGMVSCSDHRDDVGNALQFIAALPE